MSCCRPGRPGPVPGGGGGQQGDQAPQHGPGQAEVRQDQPGYVYRKLVGSVVDGSEIPVIFLDPDPTFQVVSDPACSV
jgi:hypothetical protein